MNINQDKIKSKLIILISALLILLAIWVVYLVLDRPRENKQTELTSTTQLRKTEQTIYDQLFPVLKYQNKLLKEDVYFPSFDQLSNLLYFYGFQDKAGIYTLNLDTQQKNVIAEFEDVDNIIYSPNHSQAIFSVSYQNERFDKYQSPFLTKGVEDGELTYWYYNFSNKKLSKLNRNIQSLFWINDQNIIFHYYDWNKTPEENYLGKIDISTLKSEKIVDVDNYQISFVSALPDQVILQDQPTEYPSTSPLLSLDLNTKKIVPLLDGSDFIGDKSSQDNRFLSLFSYNEKDDTFELNIYDFIEQIMIKPGLTTQNQATAWSKDNIIYYVSKNNNSSLISSYNLINNKEQKLKIDITQETEIDKIYTLNNKIYLLANDFIYQYDI